METNEVHIPVLLRLPRSPSPKGTDAINYPRILYLSVYELSSSLVFPEVMTLLFSTLLPGLPTPANISTGMEKAA
jgi:hypothetical protein